MMVIDLCFSVKKVPRPRFEDLNRNVSSVIVYYFRWQCRKSVLPYSIGLSCLSFVKVLVKSCALDGAQLSVFQPDLVSQGFDTQVQPHTTEEELGMPWMMVLVGVPLMALKMCSESGRTLFTSSTGLIWNREE